MIDSYFPIRMVKPVMKKLSYGVHPPQVQPLKEGQVTHKLVKKYQEIGTPIRLSGFNGVPYQVGGTMYHIGDTFCQGCTPIVIKADSVEVLDMTLTPDSPEAQTLAFVLGFDTFAEVIAEQAASRFGLPFEGHVLTLGPIEFAAEKN